MKTRILLRLLPLMALLLSSTAFSAKRSLSLDELQAQADAIVVANIEHVRIESERSRINAAFGNADWGIYLTLRLEALEKGNVSDEQLEVRCFRVKCRRTFSDIFAPSGHYPIPGTGTRVRAYLENDDGSWNVLLPNGIVPLDSNEFEAYWSSHTNGPDNPDATEVTALRGRFTYLLPLELWVLILVAVGLFKMAVALVRWLITRSFRETPE